MRISTFEPMRHNLFHDRGITLLGLKPGANLQAPIPWPSQLTAARLRDAVMSPTTDSSSMPFFYPCFAPLSHAMLTLAAHPTLNDGSNHESEFTAAVNSPVRQTSLPIDNAHRSEIEAVISTLATWHETLRNQGVLTTSLAGWASVVALTQPTLWGDWDLTCMTPQYQNLYAIRPALRALLKGTGQGRDNKRGHSVSPTAPDRADRTPSMKRLRSTSSGSPARKDNRNSTPMATNDATATDASLAAHVESTNDKTYETDENDLPLSDGNEDAERTMNLTDSLDIPVTKALIATAEQYMDAFRLPLFYPIRERLPGFGATRTSDDWHTAQQRFVTYRGHLDGGRGWVHPVAVIAGAKNVGKSTFARHLINQLLNVHQRVAFLDTDLGQPEFGPPGLVSLHILDSPALGPPFTHTRVPYLAHCIGYTSPKEAPDQYVAAIRDLAEEFHRLFSCSGASNRSVAKTEQQPVIPLVANTHGWVTDQGYRMLLDICGAAQASHVVYLDSPQYAHTHGLGEQLQVDLADCINPPPLVQTLLSPTAFESNHNARFTALDLRTINSTMYFHCQMPAALVSPCLLDAQAMPNEQRPKMVSDLLVQVGYRPFPRWQLTHPLTARAPYIVDWQSLTVYLPFQDLPPSQLWYALNGVTVALITERHKAPTDHSTPGPVNGAPRIQYDYPSPTSTGCVGYGLIRAIDPAKRQLYILTPVPLTLLAKVAGMLRPAAGVGDVPAWAMTARGASRAQGSTGILHPALGQTVAAPYLSATTKAGVGSSGPLNRRTLLRGAGMFHRT
ncbi:Polynucleotide 5'-hydroxyl-kinase grc3 [Dimargaris xerosporica]|nr:Polynucleotide 5'-hydroxyl-kinase grc3 [Dimargaris xerosporica]